MGRQTLLGREIGVEGSTEVVESAKVCQETPPLRVKGHLLCALTYHIIGVTMGAILGNPPCPCISGLLRFSLRLVVHI